MKRDECCNKLPKFYSFPPDLKDTQKETTIDVESILKSSPRKLVLHFDINETILIGDEAGGDTVEDCLNKVREATDYSYALFYHSLFVISFLFTKRLLQKLHL